jgi:hypothetical protein
MRDRYCFHAGLIAARERLVTVRFGPEAQGGSADGPVRSGPASSHETGSKIGPKIHLEPEQEDLK